MRWGDGFILVYDITDRGSFEDVAPLEGPPGRGQAAQTGASGVAGKQGGSGPRPAGGHGGGRASGGRHGLCVLRGARRVGSGGDGWRRGGGVLTSSAGRSAADEPFRAKPAAAAPPHTSSRPSTRCWPRSAAKASRGTHCCSKVWDQSDVSSAHQGCIYSIKNTVILWNLIAISNIGFLF